MIDDDTKMLDYTTWLYHMGFWDSAYIASDGQCIMSHSGISWISRDVLENISKEIAKYAKS